MASIAHAPLRVSGEVRVPGDKSISHRALMLGALAEGRSTAKAILASDDVRSTASCLRAMGVGIEWSGADATIDGRGRRGLRAPAEALDCGNSGTSARLLAGVVAGQRFSATFIGDASLSRRPMGRVARPLRAMGCEITLTGDSLPMTIRGGELQGIDWVAENASAQIKSAILLAALVSDVRVSVREPARSRDHTERMLRGRGVSVRVDGTVVTLDPGARLDAVDTEVPADPSSAAFLAALAAISDGGSIALDHVGVNETRTGFFRTLTQMGASIRETDRRDVGGEPVARLEIQPDELRGVTVSGDIIPTMIDELPLLACIATLAAGETVIAGAGELRVKESDRIRAVATNLRALGAEVEERADGLRVVGGRRGLRGRVVTHGDHRLAMSFGVLARVPGNEIEIDDPACVSVSYPGFFDDLDRVIA